MPSSVRTLMKTQFVRKLSMQKVLMAVIFRVVAIPLMPRSGDLTDEAGT